MFVATIPIFIIDLAQRDIKILKQTVFDVPKSHRTVVSLNHQRTHWFFVVFYRSTRSEEFKGTGNCEIYLDRRMSEKRVYPSILLNKSGTRREELLLKPEILQKTWILRKLLYPMDEIEAMEFILDKMKATKNNHDFFDMMRRGG